MAYRYVYVRFSLLINNFRVLPFQAAFRNSAACITRFRRTSAAGTDTTGSYSIIIARFTGAPS